MSNTRVLVIIGLVWLASFFITFPPMFAERFGYIQDVCKGKSNCSSCESLFDLVPVYVVFATISSFFVPVLLVIITNYRTYLIVKRHTFVHNNNGRISLPTANKPKSNKLKFFIDLLTNARDKNSQIELNSLEQRQPKSPTALNKAPILTNPNNNMQQFANNCCCCCDQELLDSAYLQTSDLSSRNLFGLRLTKCFSWLMRRDCSIESKYVESRLITAAPHSAHFACNHFHHCNRLDQDRSSFEKSKVEPKNCLAKLGKCLGECYANGSATQSSSKFQNMRAFFLNHQTNSSNVQILNIDMNNHHLGNLKSCTHCALNSLVTHRAAQQQAKSGEPLFVNEDLLMVDEESTSTGSKNRLDCSAKEASLSILVNVSSRAQSNGELVNENGLNSNCLNANNLNEASSDLNAQCSVLSALGNLSPNGCLMNGRCLKETNLNCGMLGCGRRSCAKNCNTLGSNRGSYCCGYCCSQCVIVQQSAVSPFGCCVDERCANCRAPDRSLDIYSLKTGQIRSNKSSIRSNSKADNSSSKSTATTKTTFSNKSNDKDKLCKPQHHLNCAHFKNNQLAYSKQPTKAMTLIRCDHCGHTLLHDQCKASGSPQQYVQCKSVCLQRFPNLNGNQAAALKSGRKDHHLCLSSLQKQHHFHHQPKCCAHSRPQLLNGSTLHFDHHHCIHLHFQLQQHLYQQQQSHFNAGVYADPLSSESNRQESTHSVAPSVVNNSGEKIDDNQASTSSDYRRANKTNSANNSSFDDELRINCGTGQLQKSIGFFSAHKNAGGNSSTASDNGTKSAKLKRLAYYAGNSVRNVAMGSANSRNNKLNTIRREYKATKTLAIITFVFIVMWSPYYLIFLLQTVCADCFIFKNFASHIWHQTLWLGWANSYVNCILYLYFSRKLRNSIINTLLCRRS